MAVGGADDPTLALTKGEIIHQLARLNGYRSYLELCTPGTGLFYAAIDRSRLAVCHRLMYRCPNDFDDGLGVDYRSPGDDIAGCLERIRQRGLRYDIILVDPWHEYGTSFRDLSEAFELVPEGGTVVVHDCLPPTEDSTNPDGIWDPVAGGWAGITYRAYVDFVHGRDDLTYYTIDTDWGCGVVRKLGGPTDPIRPPSRPHAEEDTSRVRRDQVFASWSALGRDYRRAYRFLRRHGDTLLKLVTVDEFLAAGADEPRPSCP